MLKDLKHYNFNDLYAIKGTPNYCARYVKDFGQKTYLNGFQNYPNSRCECLGYDTRAEAINNYTLIWGSIRHFVIIKINALQFQQNATVVMNTKITNI